MPRRPESFEHLANDLVIDDARTPKRAEETTMPGSMVVDDTEPTDPERMVKKAVPPSERKTVELPAFEPPRRPQARRNSDRETVAIPVDEAPTRSPTPERGRYSVISEKKDKAKTVSPKVVLGERGLHAVVSGEAKLPPGSGRAADDTLIDGRVKVTPDEPEIERKTRIKTQRERSPRLQMWEANLRERQRREIRAKEALAKGEKSEVEIMIENPDEAEQGDTEKPDTFFGKLLRRFGMR